MIYTKETHHIEVRVRPLYNKEHSKPKNNLYVWSYDIQLHNKGKMTIQLTHRYWQIRNAFGQIEEVSGVGVVGLQPNIKPGQTFEYTSFTHLNTDSGKMGGYYDIISERGDYLIIDIPTFDLMLPVQLVTVH